MKKDKEIKDLNSLFELEKKYQIKQRQEEVDIIQKESTKTQTSLQE